MMTDSGYGKSVPFKTDSGYGRLDMDTLAMIGFWICMILLGLALANGLSRR